MAVRIVQLAGPAGAPPLDFHPALTIVDGLDAEARARLLAVFRALPMATDPGWEGLIESHGVVFDLDAANLRLLGLGRAAEVVVTPGDLPDGTTGAVPDLTPPIEGDGGPVDGLRLSHEILAHGVATLKRSRLEYEGARLQAVEAIEEARAELDPFATTAFEQAAAALDRVTGDRDEAGADEPVLSATDAARAERDDLRSRLGELDDVDLAPVLAALERAERAVGGADHLDPEAVRGLAEALALAEADVAAVETARRASGRDPEELARRLDGVRLQIERLEATTAVPLPGPEDVAELEAAHDAVVEADARVSAGRLVSKAARKALDEAVAVEEAILDRLGFPTYSAFALAQSAPGPDPETRVELETARREAAELEVALAEARAGDPHADTLAAAVTRRDELRADALAVVDVAPEDAVAALNALADDLAGSDDATAAVTGLRDALAAVGVDFGDLDLADDEVVEVGRVWVADTAELVEHRARLGEELAAAEARLAAIEAEESGAGAGDDPVATARGELEAAEARLARHRQASDRVAELCAVLEDIEARLEDLGDNISAQEALVAAAAAGLAQAEGGEEGAGEAVAEPDWLDQSGQPEGVDDTEWFLLTRLAGLRELSFAGSVPLVLDGAFAGLDRERAHRALDHVATMTDVVQVVYLGGDEAVVEWAALHADVASVVSVAAAPVG